MATGSFDGKVYLFDARSGEPVGTPFTGQDGFVWTVSFQRGTGLIASTGSAGNALITDPETGKAFGATLAGSEEWAGGAWNPAGTQFVILLGDGRIFAWDMSAEAWESRACEIADRSLTRQEWREFLPDRLYDPAC